MTDLHVRRAWQLMGWSWYLSPRAEACPGAHTVPGGLRGYHGSGQQWQGRGWAPASHFKAVALLSLVLTIKCTRKTSPYHWVPQLKRV